MSRDTMRSIRAGSGKMSRGSDVTEGALPFRAVLFKVSVGATLETSVVMEDAGMGRGLSSKRSSPFRGLNLRGVGIGRATFSYRRKDGRNHPSESREIEGGHSGASTKWRGYGARTLRRSGDRWHGGDRINLVDRVGRGGDDGGICMLKEDSPILI